MRINAATSDHAYPLLAIPQAFQGYTMRELLPITRSKHLSSVDASASILCFLEHDFGLRVGF